MNDINTATAVRDDVIQWPEGELPEQGFANTEPVMPGIYLMTLPQDLAACWVDGNPVENKVPGSPTFGQMVIRPYLKFDKAHPLVIFGGKHDGEPFTATISSNPRARGKKDDPATPYVSDVTYLLVTSLGDKTKYPSLTAQQAAINRHGGKQIRLETGLSAFCSPEKVIYELVEIPGEPGQDSTFKSVENPDGTRGCGKRWYTRSFKLDDAQAKETGEAYSDRRYCDCGAYLRGFPQIERFLPPTK